MVMAHAVRNIESKTTTFQYYKIISSNLIKLNRSFRDFRIYREILNIYVNQHHSYNHQLYLYQLEPTNTNYLKSFNSMVHSLHSNNSNTNNYPTNIKTTSTTMNYQNINTFHCQSLQL
ncbi:hypothetical protein ACTFIV_010352 [Dictyostelium citrinum]